MIGPWDPVPDLEAADELGAMLHSLGYTEDEIVARLGEDGPAADAEDATVLARRLGNGPLDDVMRLLLLQAPVARSRIVGEQHLLRLGLVVDDGGTLVPRGRIIPTEGLYLAFDSF